MPTLEPKSNEQLIMAQNKRLLGKKQIPQTDPQIQQAQNQQQQRLQSQQSLQNAMSQQPPQTQQPPSSQPPQQPITSQPPQTQQIRPTNKLDVYGQKPMVEVTLIEVTPFNRPLMVGILLQDLHILSEMVNLMSG